MPAVEHAQTSSFQAKHPRNKLGMGPPPLDRLPPLDGGAGSLDDESSQAAASEIVTVDCTTASIKPRCSWAHTCGAREGDRDCAAARGLQKLRSVRVAYQQCREHRQRRDDPQSRDGVQHR